MSFRAYLSIALRTGFLLLAVTSCSDSEPSSGTGPNAPSGLAVAPLSGGAHVTWIDNASNEDEFAIMRLQVGTDPALREIDSVPFNTTQYHDTAIASGTTYSYKIVATNASGESATTEVMFVAP